MVAGEAQCRSPSARHVCSEIEDRPYKRERKPVRFKGWQEYPVQLYKQRKKQQAELIDRILREESIKASIQAVNHLSRNQS